MKHYGNYEELLNAARNYDRCEDFIAEVGWEDWMVDLLADAGSPTTDGDELSERQIDLINEYLRKIWDAR